ncbi:L-rhamnose mutarotase [Salinisphaera sp. SPP-AMP-43]|uniref:L-rhamnose mutarotase n=1 Tax=Salinisphaera sp. SPP-AMP-43 TaxID=3121288 RepID=UPI003C6DCB35
MPVRAFEMQLYPGQVAEYRRRHDAIWPELADLLREAGVYDYRIFVNEDSGRLFAVMHLAEAHHVDELPGHEVMQRWWAYMADIMETAPDDAPITEALEPVFAMTPESNG